MKKYIFPLVLALSLGFTSCSSDDDSPKPTTQNDPANDLAAIQLTTQLLTDHTWKLTALTQSVPGQAIKNDIYNNSFPACQRDDIYSFAGTNSALTIATGLTACNATDQGKTGNWSLKNAKTITITVPAQPQAGLTGEFNIFQLDNNTMILTQTINGSEYIATYEKFVVLTKTQLLTGKTWKLQDQTISVNGGNTTNTIGFYDACELDNIFEYAANNIFSISEGTTKCNAADPQVYSSGTWAFKNNNTRISIVSTTDTTEQEILELTPTKLVLKETINDSVFTFTAISTFN